MKPATLPTSVFRRITLFFIMVCALVLSVVPASASGQSDKKQEIPREQALLAELAGRVRERALFAARIAPEISRIIKKVAYGHGYNNPDSLIDSLWAMRFNPIVQKEWMDKFSAPGLSEDECRRLLRDFGLFMDKISHQAGKMPSRGQAKGNLWARLRQSAMYIGMAYESQCGNNPENQYLRTMAELEQVKAREKAFADVLVLIDSFEKLN